jgi:ABC-2 type transport system ATP-binding protein
MDALMQAMSAAGIEGLVSQPPSLEDLFLSHYDSGTTSRPADA